MATVPMYHGSYYFLTTAATDNILNTPIKCAGTTTGNDCNGFSHSADNRLSYTGAVSRVFNITCTFSATCSGATDAIFYLYKNGELVPGSKILRTIGTGSPAGAGAVSSLVKMKKDDYVELWCETDASADDLTIESGVMIATVAG